MKRKVFVLAWDGATLDRVRPWAEAGLLPNIKRVFEQGASGTLRSTIPPVTPVAWLSFSTGRNPGQHGVFDFFRPARQHYADLIPTSAALSHEPTLWSRLSEAGRKSIVVNVPMTYPAEKIDGVIISGPPSPAGDKHAAYPPDVLNELKAHGWDLTRDATSVHGAFEDYFPFLCELVEQRTAAVLYLMEKYPWDFFMVHYLETDQVQHSYWRFLEGGGPNADAMLKLYQRADTALGQVLARLGTDVALVVLSDHGMGPTEYHVNLNNWLAREGFLKWRRQPSTMMRRALYALGLDPTSVYNRIPAQLIQRLSLGEVRADVQQVDKMVQRRRPSFIARLRKALLRAPFLNFNDVDWLRTVAYVSGTTQAAMLYLNVKGREPQGVIALGAHYERVRNQIADRLQTVIDPYSGERLISQVLRREELYRGTALVNAPDLVALYRGGEYDNKKGTVFLSKRVVDRVANGNATHRQLGFVALMGAAIKSGYRLSDADMLDLPSTILALMDEPIPAEFEGRVLQEALIEPAQIAIAPKRDEHTTSDQADMSPEELEQVLDKLRALGYVD